MEGNWSVTFDGKTHAVRAHLATFSFAPQLTVYLDGALIHSQRVFFFAGELGRLKACGHDLSIRISGFGVLGNLNLLIDDLPALQFSDAISASRPPLPPLGRSLDSSIVETKRVEEPLGEDVRDIDNSQSVVEIQRKVRVSREWSQTYVLERESTTKAGGELSLQGAWILDARASAERAIRKRYELTVEDRQTYSEELTIEVPARTKVRVVLQWKQLWQCGVVLVRNGNDGTEVQVPYRVCIGPTFDQRQVDG